MIENLLDCLFGLLGCWHDWEELEFIDREKIRHAIDCEIAGRYLPSLSTGNYAVKKVCLKCVKVVDEISEEQQAYRAKLLASSIRQKRARELIAE